MGGKKSMSSVQLTGKMNLMSFLSMQTILCSIRRAVKEIRGKSKGTREKHRTSGQPGMFYTGRT